MRSQKEVVGLLGMLESVEMKVWNLANKAFEYRGTVKWTPEHEG